VQGNPRSILLVASFGSAVIGFCGSSLGADNTHKPLVVGAVIAETGFMEQYDQPAWTAAKLAIDDINKGVLKILGEKAPGLLGRTVKFVVRDYRSDRSVAPVVAQEVVDSGAELLIASCDYDFGSPAALVAQQAGIVSMSLCAGSPRFGPEGGLPLGFSAGSVAEATSAAFAEWAHGEKKWRTAYLLNDPVLQVDTDWSKGFNTRFTELAGKDAIIGSNSFRNDDADINSQINAIRALPKKPDVLVITSFPPGGASAVRQIRAAGIDTPIILNDAMDGNSWWSTIAPAQRVNIFIAVRGSYFGNDPRPEINALTSRYKEVAGVLPPSSLFLDGYGAIQMLALAAKRAGTTDGKAVTAALEHFRDVPRVAGPATFTHELHDAPNRGVAILELKGQDVMLVGLHAPDRVPKYANIVDKHK
jgi:branched-chain amino acid transport system substrate-binding protein